MIKNERRILKFSICILIIFGMINLSSSKARINSPNAIGEDTTDIDKPVVSEPADVDFTEGATDQIITWTLNDANPDTYSIIVDQVDETNNTVLRARPVEINRTTGSWINGQNISYDVSSLPTGRYYPIGKYYVRIEVYDSYDNYKTDYVTVIVRPLETTGTISGMEFLAGIISLFVAGLVLSTKRRK